jgi:hypothetical protein
MIFLSPTPQGVALGWANGGPFGANENSTFILGWANGGPFGANKNSTFILGWANGGPFGANENSTFILHPSSFRLPPSPAPSRSSKC